MKPSEVLSCTPREFTILMEAHSERIKDEYERMASQAMMIRQAYHAKRLKFSDLYKRPVDEDKALAKSEDLIEKSKNASEWLSQFTQFTTARKEEADG